MSMLMDQRHYPRLPVQLEVCYTILGNDSKIHTGYARDVSENGLRLVTETPLQPGAFLRIQIQDATLFGEIRHCTPSMDLHVSGVYIEEILVGPSELSRLISATLNQVPKLTPAANRQS